MQGPQAVAELSAVEQLRPEARPPTFVLWTNSAYGEFPKSLCWQSFGIRIFLAQTSCSLTASGQSEELHQANAERDAGRVQNKPLESKALEFFLGIIVEPSEHHGCPGSILVGVHAHATRRCGFLMLPYSFGQASLKTNTALSPESSA